ncbi:MAG TPA: PIN domain-containing protein [Rhizomicrobium sp.]|jgi:predicted nucleic acid-binding protein|nr:PIN domain-containing protein [Rhizomicrobium sp.]
MNAKPFLDTNILLYAFTTGVPRSARAEALLEEGGTVSVQVLNEFVNVSRRKLRRPWQDIEDALGVLKTLLDAPLPLTLDLHETAIGLARDHRISFYDGLIVAAASRAGCRVLYSEDLRDGRELIGVTVRNPFAQ